MARSYLQRRQEAERARAEAYDAVLRRVCQRARPTPDFDLALTEAACGFSAAFVRDPESWRPQIKTRDAGRLRLAAARHLFARYPVADHLEQVWLDARGLDAAEVLLRKRWYIAAASGGSVYREGASAWLSRKEVHAFLNPPGRLGFDEAIWFAIARSYAPDVGVALRIARSRIARSPRAELGRWRDVVRFFCTNPATVEEIDDLCDYLGDCFRRTEDYSMKGRTLASLRRQMHVWHEDLQAIARIEAARRRAEAARATALGLPPPSVASTGGTWKGAAIADWSWNPSSKTRRSTREEFVVVQLKTAADLVAETRAMSHCVASYAAKCIAGHASIWSLRWRAEGQVRRLLTIELDAIGTAVQVRGFANRSANEEERKILERWAKARGIFLR